ncbi:EAL domain-containing protein [Endobacter medicaginis]|uniref:EAL domain-containing protein n=2 Tax=Endobacter medicaginis TaxID=1181271 RepID=A0A850NQ28_9PROT|nr:EAL domain-containing protein [Endobacter medicaginis]NVN29966.1 EAL domain-containing protein [Endobacter medicaginis]
MTQLLAQILHLKDPASLPLLLVVCLVGAAASLLALKSTRRALLLSNLGFASILTLALWIGTHLGLQAMFPKLVLDVPARWLAGSLVFSLVGASASGTVLRGGQHSARNAMLAGSILACGISCMILTALAGLVRPFALAYDLRSVLLVMLIGSTLCCFSLWEATRPLAGVRRVLPCLLLGLAIFVLILGSLGSILPFEQWMTAALRPDQIATMPVAIVAGAEAIVVLLLSLTGSLIDNRAAARDRREADRLRQLADSTFEGILVVSRGRILDANRALGALLGIDIATLREQPISRLLPDSIDPATWQQAANELSPVATSLRSSNDTTIPVEILGRNIVYGHIDAQVIAVRDIRERTESEARIRFLAEHDALTGLPNRRLFNEKLQSSLTGAAVSGTRFALFRLDLDSFKTINDTLGHNAGDELLSHVARTLRACVGSSDFIARIGGDEFVALRAPLSDTKDALDLAQQFLGGLAEPLILNQKRVQISTSIGVSIYPVHGMDAESLLSTADIALYRAKSNGRGRVCVFEVGMNAEQDRCRELERELHGAIAAGGLSLLFQPLFRPDGDLVCFEALLRWTHMVHGAISPAEFIPLAESSELIVPIGAWVLQTACQEAVAWPCDQRVAVNISAVQLLSEDFVTTVSQALSTTGLAPERLELEVTESVLIENTDQTLTVLSALRALGLRLVLDDFGTGYSSLSYLHRFRFDKLKLDRSFVQRLDTDEDARTIVRAMISMSKDLGLEVTAEGVETPAQLAALRELGCDELQGFLLGRPMPKSRIRMLIMRHHTARAADDLTPLLVMETGDEAPDAPADGANSVDHTPQALGV